MRRRIDEIRAHFDWTTERFPGNTAEHYTFPFPESMSQTAWITDRAIEFIQSTPKERPFFAQVSHVQPHSPYCAPEDCMDSVDAAKIPEPVEAEWTRDPFAPAYFRNRKPADADWMSVRRYYFASLAYLDRQLGRILEALEKAGRLSQTHIFLLSDHGDLLGDHGLSGKYEKHYDACARVPLIVAGPGLKRGIVTDRLVQLEDILPTILDIAGVQAPPMPKTGPLLATPAEHIPQFPGRSLLPILRGESTGDWRQAAYCESFNSTKSDDPGDWARTIITDKRRYTVYPGGGDQLFDRRKDPDELHNLAGNPLFAADRRRLRDELLEMIVLRDYPKPRRELFAFGVH
jgi:arylsulfatase A-like enzyme